MTFRHWSCCALVLSLTVFSRSLCCAFTLRNEARVITAARKRTADSNRDVEDFRWLLTLTQVRQGIPRGLNALPAPDASTIAEGLGYLVGAGSLLLYTPIALRVTRQGSADGLTLSTWWLKLSSYTCSDIYAYSRGYPISTYAETLVITAEAATILILVSYFQKRIDTRFAVLSVAFGAAVIWALATPAPPSITALGQASSTVLNTSALLPQILLNANRRSSGDYSPVTAGLAAVGCAIRLFTTVQLADSDLMLLGGFGIAFLLNSALLAQIIWLGISVEGRSLGSVMMADLGSRHASNQSCSADEEERTRLESTSR